LQSEGAKKSQEDAITDWLLSSGESGNELETRTIDATELISQLHAQSEDTAKREKEREDAEARSGVSKPDGHASSRDAASELLRKFFKGGK